MARVLVLCLIVGLILIPGAAGAKVWNVSYVPGVGNCTSLLDIDDLSEGDTIRIWGENGHTYEGGISIDVPGVSVIRWKDSSARPLITNTSQTAPAITVTASGVSLEGLDISDNTYAGNGAGVCAEGEYDNPLQGFDLIDCVFTGNSVTGDYVRGGAVYLYYVDNCMINGTIFESNEAAYNGGGAYFKSSNNLKLSGVTFENNQAGSDGGGIGSDYSHYLKLSETTFENNTAGSNGGGACFDYSDYLSITGVAFENNQANNGGGAYFQGSSYASLSETTFENNTAGSNGGGAYFQGSADALIINCLFDNENNLFADNSAARILNRITPIPGTNIAGGPYIGGNVWLRDPAQNISEWGADADYDGLCDQNMTIADLGTDEYPLMYGGGTVEVSSAPDGAYVYLDGVNTTRTTDACLYLPAGEHNITVSLDNYLTPPEEVVSVTAGHMTSVSFGPLVHAAGSLSVSSVPSGAHIILDGADTGNLTDSTLSGIWTGDHTLTVSLDGHLTPPEQVVQVTTGNTTSVSFGPLVRATGSLSVSSVPSGAHIILDGADTNNLTDSTLSGIRAGDHTVTVRLDNYLTPPEQVVRVTAGNPTSLSFSPDPVPTPARRTHSSAGGRSGLSAGAAENLPEGGQASFAVHNSAISEIKITADDNIPKILVTVEKTALPSGVDAPPGTLYEYDEFILYHAADDMIRGLSLNFSVSKTWLSEHGLVPEDVLLYSLHDGKWSAVLITLTGEDAGSYHFTARSEGFSGFAICAEPLREPTPTPTQTFATEAEVTADATATTAPASTEQQTPLFWGTAVLGAGVALLLRRRI